jgi:hypothetical protein
MDPTISEIKKKIVEIINAFFRNPLFWGAAWDFGFEDFLLTMFRLQRKLIISFQKGYLAIITSL